MQITTPSGIKISTDKNRPAGLRIFMILLLVPVMFLLYGSPAVGDEGLNVILNGILDRYGKLPGLTVPYKREIISRSMTMLGGQVGNDPASGKIHFKPPHYLAIKQETPKPETVTTDGETLWWYIPDKKLVYQYPSEMLGKELRLLSSIFRGLSRVEENFDVVQSDLDNNLEYNLKLIPTPPWEDIDHIAISVIRDDYDVHVVEIHNVLGNITRFILGDFSVEKDLTDEFFRFVPPEGVKVIREKG